MANETPAKVRKAFFISPIGDASSSERHRSDVVLVHILKPVLVPKYVDEIERADRMADPGEITPAIVNAIVDADLIIADLSDANPNVYYELAIAHAFAKPVIHIIEEGHTPRFDVKDVRAFPYGIAVDKADAAKIALGEAASIATGRGNHPTLVSRAAELRAAATSENPVERQLAEIREQLRDIGAETSVGRRQDKYALGGFRAPRKPDSGEARVDSMQIREHIDIAGRDAAAHWLGEFIRRFEPYIDDGRVAHSQFVALRDNPELVDDLDVGVIRELAHSAIGMYEDVYRRYDMPTVPPLPIVTPF